MKARRVLGVLWLYVLLAAGAAGAAAEPFKVVMQVSSDEVRTHYVALNNTMNLLAEFGPETRSEIVAYGPGLSMLTVSSQIAERVTRMARAHGVVFSVCDKHHGRDSTPHRKAAPTCRGDGGRPSGIAPIAELQKAG